MVKDFIGEFSKKINDALPESAKNTHAEIERVVKSQFEQMMGHFKFVKQEDFEVQQKILLKTRQEIDSLKKEIENLKFQSSSNSEEKISDK